MRLAGGAADRFAVFLDQVFDDVAHRALVNPGEERELRFADREPAAPALAPAAPSPSAPAANDRAAMSGRSCQCLSQLGFEER